MIAWIEARTAFILNRAHLARWMPSTGSANKLLWAVPSRGIHHVDLAVSDVKRSLAFYLDLLGPLGWEESVRYPSYRGTEEVVYLKDAAKGSREPGSDSSMLAIRRADGGVHRYYGVGIEHFAFEVDRREEVDEAHARCLASGATVHFPPEEDRDEPGYYAFFAFDPDGIRVEVFCWPPERAEDMPLGVGSF